MSAPVKGTKPCCHVCDGSGRMAFDGQAGFTCDGCGGTGEAWEYDAPTPVPVPVVIEVAEALWVGLEEDEQSCPWADIPDHWEDRGNFLRAAEAVLDSPSVRAAFEAQAKLEAERTRIVTEIVAALRDSMGWIEDDAYADWVEKRFLWEGGESS